MVGIKHERSCFKKIPIDWFFSKHVKIYAEVCRLLKQGKHKDKTLMSLIMLVCIGEVIPMPMTPKYCLNGFSSAG